MNRIVYPPGGIGIIGGGQLGKMLAFEAKRMGYKVFVLDPKPDAPAGVIADRHFCADFSDETAVFDLAAQSAVITYEFEHIHLDTLEKLERTGHRVVPCAATLERIQDKLIQKTVLREAGIAVPDFAFCKTFGELAEFFAKARDGAVLKSRRGGYDGKGTFFIRTQKDLDALQTLDLSKYYVEETIRLQCELSVIVARGNGEEQVYPVAENIHDEGILTESIVPAGRSDRLLINALETALAVSRAFPDDGLLCIELFADENDRILVNELAPRAHNTGHYSIEACETSQYEQWLRILTGMPLKKPRLKECAAMLNILGPADVCGCYRIAGLEQALKIPSTYVHLYGKSETFPRKKIGHITSLGPTTHDALKRAKKALQYLRIEPLDE